MRFFFEKCTFANDDRFLRFGSENPPARGKGRDSHYQILTTKFRIQKKIEFAQTHTGLAHDVARHSPGPKRSLAALFASFAASRPPLATDAGELSQQGGKRGQVSSAVVRILTTRFSQPDSHYQIEKSVIVAKSQFFKKNLVSQQQNFLK